MIEIIFDYIIPIISFAMGIFVLIRVRQLIDRDTLRLIKQIKSWWGNEQADRRWTKEHKSKAYESGKKKIGAKIKAMVPFGLLDELTDDEVHEYLLNPDTIQFLEKAKGLLGGIPNLEIPQLQQQSRQSTVPEMRRDGGD